MTTTQAQHVDAATIRRDYLDGLNAMTAQSAEELRKRLAEHVRGLVPAVQERMPYMGPYRQAQAEHCLTRAAETLEGVPAGCDAVGYTYDLAVSARALLVLYRRPGLPE